MCTKASSHRRCRTDLRTPSLSATLLTCAVAALAAGCGSAEQRRTSPTLQGPGTSDDGAAPLGTTQPPAESGCGHRGDAEPPRLAGITAAHNAIRCRVSRPSGETLPPLAWSSALAADAQRYAAELAKSRCGLKHSQTDHGENLFGGSGRNTPDHVVERWAREQRCFQYQSFPQCCSCTCGHYTQIVWGDTRRLGCGMASCPDGAEVWVCRYDPAGNYAGRSPY